MLTFDQVLHHRESVRKMLLKQVTMLKGTLRENVLKGLKTTLSKQILKLWIAVPIGRHPQI